jgi:glyoxylase-like metal-dependent hydrolase (beta-lactamase superfamily II)
MKRILLDGQIPVNCFIIEDEGKCYVVDPGFQKERLQSYIDSLGLEVIGILLTHVHYDHIGALDAFDVPIYVNEKEYPNLLDGFINGFDYDNRKMAYNIDDLYIIKCNENTRIFLNKKEIEIILTPGHTCGGVCYKYGNELITGDTLFKGAVGQWDFPTGDQEILRQSIINLIDSQDDDVIIYPAHGPASTIGEERLRNVYYSQWKSTGKILKDHYLDYEAFQKARQLLAEKKLHEAQEILKNLINRGDANPLTYMYYEYTRLK